MSWIQYQSTQDSAAVKTTRFRMGGRMAGLCLALPFVATLWGGEAGKLDDPSKLADQSLEQLLNTPVITVSKKAQPLSRVPAAVYVITQEAIRRSGAANIPEALRLAPGVQVARTTLTQWAISIRGFNGLFSNKLLVMVDGRTIYSEIFSGVDWEMQNLLLEDIDRIEVVRGPGSTMWGANAVNGVINIVMKAARDSKGGLVQAETGTETHGAGAVQFGGKFKQGEFRAYLRGIDASLPQLRGTRESGSQHDYGTGFRIDSRLSDKDSLTVQGEGVMAHNHDPESVGSALEDVNSRPSTFSLQTKLTRALSDRGELSLQFYATDEHRSEANVSARVSTEDASLQYTRQIGNRNEIVSGVESRTSSDRVSRNNAFSFNPTRRTEELASAFAQDEITIVPDRLQLTGGLKVEHTLFTGFEVEPSAQVSWTPTEHQTFWGSVGRAVRTPSRYEHDIDAIVGLVFSGPFPGIATVVGNPKLQSESVLAYDLGHRIEVGPRLSFDTSAYLDEYGTLRSVQSLPPRAEVTKLTIGPQTAVFLLDFPQQYDQLARGRGFGVEESANWNVRSNWRLTGIYSFGMLDTSKKPGNNASVDLYAAAPGSLPRHQAQLRSQWDLSRQVQFDSSVHFVDRLPSEGLPSYTLVNARLGWRPVSRFDLSANVENIFNKQHVEWNSKQDLIYTGKMFGRIAELKATWHF